MGVNAARPADSATLAGFVAGEFGPGPFWWVDEWAQVTNVLPPLVASLATPWPNTVPGGPLALGDGTRVGRSLLVTNASAAAYLSHDGEVLRLPCVAGVAVTASAWLSAAGALLRVEVRSATGGVISVGTAARENEGLGRVSASVVPPPGADHLVIAFAGGGRIARPALTWTADLLDYHGGQGASSVVIEGLDQEVLLAHRGPWGRLAALSYRVLEVG